jgi:hypothetical protein
MKLYAPKAARSVMQQIIELCRSVPLHKVDKDLSDKMYALAEEVKGLLNERELRRTP